MTDKEEAERELVWACKAATSDAEKVAAIDAYRAALKAQPAPTEATEKPTAHVWFHRGLLNFDGEDEMLIKLDDGMGTSIPLYLRTKASTEAPNFCSRCGKRLHTGSIHTCTPPASTEAQGEDSARLDAADLATIEEATKVLESAAKHNEGLGRTVFAHVQRDRAVRLRAILDRVRASAETGGVKP